MSREFLADRRKALEEEFFRQEDRRKLEALRAAAERRATAAELREVSGIEDEAVLEELAGLGLTRETLAAVALAPLIHVAWADRRIVDTERGTVLARAHDKGIETGSPAYELLERWLKEPPAAALFEGWTRYVRALSASLLPERAAELRRQIVSFAREVALAAGGAMNVGKITEQQQRVLDAVEAAFNPE
jgi:hypothetical protein